VGLIPYLNHLLPTLMKDEPLYYVPRTSTLSIPLEAGTMIHAGAL
jgi:hypothetical protein